MIKIAGLSVGVLMMGAAAFFASRPWRVHGGQFVSEYMWLAGGLGSLAIIILALSYWAG